MNAQTDLSRHAAATQVLKGNAKNSQITVRRETFEFNKDKLSRYFVKDNPMLTHLFIALSSTFPTGERFFVHSVRNVRDRVQNQTLQHDISAFIGQEAMHSHAHEDFNVFAEELGLDIQTIVDEEHRETERMKRILTEKQQLAATCALEHFTAIFAKYFMENEQFYHDMHPDAARLWFWHAIEETEHKAVAFDVYQEVFADQKERKRVMFVVTISFLARIANLTRRLMFQDKQSLTAWRKHIEAMNELRKMAMSLKAVYMDYYRDDFHPNDDDTSHLTEKWYRILGLEKSATAA